jgi:polysaccharide biosynthesis protein PslH
MQTVFATSHTPTLDSGRARRTYGLVRALAAHGPLDLVYGAFGAGEPDEAYRSLAGVELHRVERPGPLTRAPAYLRARLRRVPNDFARGIWPGIGATAGRLLAARPEARLIADGPVVAAGLLPLAAGRDAVYSAHNLESSFRHRLGEADMSLGSLERFERLLLDRYAEAWMVSPVDMEGAAALAPDARLRLVPNVVDVSAIRPLPPRQGQRAVLFVADFAYEPNRQALRFLLDEAMPSLWAAAADARLIVAGKGSERFDAADPRVELRGFVPDLGALYDEAGCVAVPLLDGGGSPLKFVEALAYGLPVVATPFAAAGLSVEPGRDFAQADGRPEAFAAELVAVLRGERPGLGREGRELVARSYSIEAVARAVGPRGS